MVKRTAAIVLAIFLASCGAARGPVAGVGDNKSDTVGGTISGIVRAAADTPLSGRKVTITNVETGAKLEASTAINGGYTLQVPRGHYRIDVELRPGEAISKRPDEVHITASDIDASRDFVITVR